MPTYGRIDIAFERGEGPYLHSTDGRRFLDFASGIATNSLGHAHPALVKTIADQAARLMHVSNLYRIPEQEALADKLVATSFADTVFFCNSGAESLEGSIKVARRYQFHVGQPHRTKVICCNHAFHGRTLGTLSATDKEAYREGFGPRVQGFTHVAFGNLNEMRDAAAADDAAAILVEPVQGEGGIFVAPPEYLQALREIADEFGLMLIFDEVQCGMGRTGKLWAHEWSGIVPDIMASAKGLGGGFPVGAVLASEKAASGMKPGLHGSTYGGNPLAMAAAKAVVDIIAEPAFLDHVVKTAASLRDKLQTLPAKYPGVIEEVRGSGLLMGLKCVVPTGDLQTALREEQGLLTVGAGENVLRLLPPLTIDESHVAEAVGKIDAACAGLARHAA
ncbi:MAG: aspartate aminotransferase family protein [Thalassobaculaceae bacterium]|nr:aspartate aminotransferase family protein [Thalassobaculaceae bacterium]